MLKHYLPHEPNEPVLSAEEAFEDARQSEARWQHFEQTQHLRRLLIELPEPAFLALEQLAARQQQSVAHLVGRVMLELVESFVPSAVGQQQR